MEAGNAEVGQHEREVPELHTEHSRRVLFLYAAEYFGRGEAFAGFGFPSRAEQGVKQLLFGGLFVECGVVSLDFKLFLCRKPITFARLQFGFELRVKLVVVNGEASILCVSSTQRKRRLPVGSLSKSFRLEVAMNEAMRGNGRKFF